MHARFRYAAFNLWMREVSSARSRWLINKSFNNNQGLTFADLRSHLEGDANYPFLNSIVRVASSVKGTRPFWKRRGRELSAHIKLLGKPAIFFTFSAADTQWDSLQRHLPRYWEWLHSDDDTRYVFIFRRRGPLFGKEKSHSCSVGTTSIVRIFAQIRISQLLISMNALRASST
jgi:hypothetical protein